MNVLTAYLVAIAAFPCPLCSQVDRLVQEGDTAQAISLLRERVREREQAREEPVPEVAGRLGELLVHTGESRAVEFEDRAEAQEMLGIAIDGDQDNPRWWYAIGLLDRMRGLQLDASRHLERALDLAEERPEALTRAERARAHAEMARAAEEHVLDFRGFVAQTNEIPVVQGGGEQCAVAFCLNFERPDWFHEILFTWDTQEQLVEEDRRRMMELFREAFRIDPSHPMAARGLLGALARSHEWGEFLDVARSYDQAAPDEPWASVFLGAALHRTGQAPRADSVFRSALRRLPPGDRGLLSGIDRIVRRRDAEALAEAGEEERQVAEDFIWRRLDPFFLSDANERWLEHLTRVALAEIWYGDPRIHERGALTDPGTIFIRYGEPEWVRQIRISDAAAGAIQDLTGAKPAVGGRWIFWTYSKTTPSYIFEKQLGARRIQHATSTSSREVEEYMRDQMPSSYRPENFLPLEHQLVRFKGRQVEVEADVIMGLPEVETEDDVMLAEAGAFIVPGRPGQEPVGLRTTVDLAAAGGDATTFRLPLNRGDYRYSVELISEDRSVLGSSRGTLEAQDFGTADFFLSDLLVADSIRPTRDQPGDRRHFRIKGSPDLLYTVGEPIGFYFEIYGLEEDDGLARYDVEVRMRSEEEGGLLRGALRGLSGILGGEAREDDGVLKWSGQAQGAPERVPEWFNLSLPDLEPGVYSVEVRVRDREGGDDARIQRSVTLVSPGEAGEG